MNSRVSSVLALGPCCPAGKHINMNQLEIVRPLACSHSCFISTVRIQQAGADAVPPGPTGLVPCNGSSIDSLGVAKSYCKAKLDDNEVKQVEVEVKVHQQLASNPYVVPFWAAIDTLESITIVTGHCEGDLRGMLQQAGTGLAEETVRRQIAAPMLHVLTEMHSKRFVHRDIKPENIFISGSHVMLGDFGLAIVMPPAAAIKQQATAGLQFLATNDSTSSNQSSPEQYSIISPSSSAGGSLAERGAQQLRSCKSSHNVIDASINGIKGSSTTLSKGHVSVIRRSSSCSTAGYDCSVVPQLPTLHAGGTAAYTAPEVVAAAFHNTSVAEAVGPQNDVWSLAVLLLECLKGRHPFGNPTMSAGAFMCSIISRTQAQINTNISTLPVSQACKDWLQLALTIDVKQRATAEQLEQHSWITGARHSSSSSEQACQPRQTCGLQTQQQLLPQLHVTCPEQLRASALLHSCTSESLECAHSKQPTSSTESAGAPAPSTAGSWEVCSLRNTALASCQRDQRQQQATCSWEAAAAAAHDAAGPADVLRFSGGSVGIACHQQQHKAASQLTYMESIGSWED